MICKLEKIGTKNFYELSIIVISAVIVRIIFFAGFNYQIDLYGGDSKYYIETGRNILEYGVHGVIDIPTFYRPPLYSFFAGIIAYISETAAFFYVLQSIISISFSISIYFILQKYGPKISFWSALLIAVSPFDILMNGRILSENLVTPLLILGSFYFINSSGFKKRFFISGILLGSVALCRDIYVLFPLFLLVIGFFMKITWKNLAIFFLAFLMVVAPWAYRNSQLPSGGLFLSKGIFWTNLWMGTWEINSDWTRITNPYILPPEALQTVDNGESPTVVIDAFNKNDEDFFKNVVISYIQKNPLKVLYAWIVRYPILWLGTRSGLNTSILARNTIPWYLIKAIFYFINGLIVILAVLGFFVASRSKRLPFLISIPVIYNAIIYIPFHNVEARYTLPVMPILIIYACFFVLYTFEKFKLIRAMK
jgi:hypothetical protein